MKKFFLLACWIATGLCLHAQVGKVGINTTTPAAMLQVKDSSVVFTGTLPLPGSPGAPPVSGAGTRMMWYANKGAFRVGSVSGTQWNKDSIGINSFACGADNVVKGSYAGSFGYNNNVSGSGSLSLGTGNEISGFGSLALGIDTYVSGGGSLAIGTQSGCSGFGSIASGFFAQNSGNYSILCGFQSSNSGDQSICGGSSTNVIGNNSLGIGSLVFVSANNAMGMGTSTDATGESSFAGGSYSTASGLNSFAFGGSNTAANTNATAFGEFSQATGVHSFAIGNTTTASPFASFVGGQFNELISGSPTSWVDTDPLFVLGTGLDDNNRKNGITILKNGKTGFSTSSPDALIHVVKDTPTNGPYNANVAAILEGDQGSFLQFSNDNAVQGGILSGNKLTAIRSAIIFRPDSMIQLRAGGNTNRMAITKNGNIGINTSSPQRLLHVTNGNSGATSAATTIAILESNTDAALSLLTPNADESAIYFGNPANAAHGGIVYNSTVANGLAFRTNGNNTKMVISDVGNVGIGDNSPDAKLHVSNGSSGASYNASASMVVEDNSTNYIQLATPSGNESGIISSTDLISLRSSLIFRPDSAVQIRTGGNSTRIHVNKTGEVGIGTTSPTSKLHVVGNGLFTGTVTASCGVLSCSDIRYKKNIQPLQDVLGEVMHLQGVYYDWDLEKFPDKGFAEQRQLGIIAQDLEQHFPELVHTDTDGYKTVDYCRLAPVLLEAIKEQQAQIEWLMREVKELKEGR